MAKKKVTVVLLIVAILTLSAFAFTACNDDETKPDSVKVTFLNGTEVLETKTVEKGKTVGEWTPEKTGYDFIDWFATPAKTHTFDFTKPINEDTNVYAGFSLFKADTRTFFIVGSGKSAALFESNWGAVVGDKQKMTKAADSNTYTITLDLFESDQFQFAINSSWENKRGYGYLENTKLADGTVVFAGEGGLGETNAKGKNISVKKDGNYTLTLKTYPNDDFYDTDNATYTEETKEVYNIGTYDKITFVRNGDTVGEPVVATEVDCYIKGGMNEWEHNFSNDWKLKQNENNKNLYEITLAFEEGWEVGLAQYNVGDTEGFGNWVGRDNIGTAGDANASFNPGSGNLKCSVAGTYRVVYNVSENTIDFYAVTEQ